MPVIQFSVDLDDSRGFKETLRALNAVYERLHAEEFAKLLDKQRAHVLKTIAPEDNPAAGVEVAPALPAAVPALPSAAEVFSATMVPQPPAANPATPVGELDSAGQPWNADLHASTKAKNADGTWRVKRGAKGKAEGNDVPADVPMPPPAVSPGPAVPPAPSTATITPPLPSAVAAPPATTSASTPPALPAGVAQPGPTNFMELMSAMSPRFAEYSAQFVKVCGALQLSGIGELQNKPELVPAFWQMLNNLVPKV